MPQQTPQESSYPVEVENIAEMARLTRQARVFTGATNLLPDDIHLSAGQALDIGCGPGEWVLALAEQYPDLNVVGIDVSEVMTRYAQALAVEKELSHVRFRVMDVCKGLAFPEASFDLLHIRTAIAFLTPALWSAFLRECYRVLKPGGILLGVEGDDGGSNSPSLTRLMVLMMQALRKVGHCFTSEGTNSGIVSMYPRLLREAGLSVIRREAFLLDYSYGTPAHGEMTQDLAIAFRLATSFFSHLTNESEEEIEILRQRALEEIQAPDFCASFFIQRISAMKPA
ncbi:class I SAM-dependent methyltransferase [Ktedonosporobacter rubrisoli]|uniref:Class I SAM-dependent methyltransferase n=1 Tax=Ktedonosporobacter rubrisoli TaxID=2509675 RepID=A0A4P6JMV7_KTERU|nr:class I SAM-dependent methyltransferase [Ktedonosporobacter rubrisoli]QBD76609.1 class I SAM-dependent methyltransferase [Ktedonosporobacter rubrisoli]